MTVKELDDRYETCLRQSREFQTKMKDAGNENIMVNDVEPADKSRTQRHDNFCDPMALMMWSWINSSDPPVELGVPVFTLASHYAQSIIQWNDACSRQGSTVITYKYIRKYGESWKHVQLFWSLEFDGNDVG